MIAMTMIIAIVLICIVNGATGKCPNDEETQSKSFFYKNASVLADPVECPIARDCKEWYKVGITTSGIYPIKPDDGPSFQVYCDMETEGGGWTVFQRRQDGSVDFYRNWRHYKKGFGTLSSEHWLGLSKLHRLTPDTSNTLRVDLKDFSNNTAYAQYSTFQISDSKSNFTLIVSGYNGTAGDSLSYHNKMKFSTKDRDYNRCAVASRGGWWYNNCYLSNLNGLYVPGRYITDVIIWLYWKNSFECLKFTEMKVRHN